MEILEEGIESAVDTLSGDEVLRKVRASHLDRLLTVLAGGKPDRPMGLSGIWGHASANPFEEPERCVQQQIISLDEQRDLLRTERFFVPGITGIGLHGVHFIDDLLGAEVFDLDGSGNWQVRSLDQPVGTLEAVDLERSKSKSWELVRRGAAAFMETGVENVSFETPCLSSPLNVAINLYGQEFLLAMYEDPAAARADLEVITDLLVELHMWYQRNLPSDKLQVVGGSSRYRPPGRGHLCGCSNQLVSPELYKEFIVPCNERVLSTHPRPGMIHLCGAHTQHIPAWREMSSLGIIQINDRASIDLAEYLRELRDDQVVYNLDRPDMPWRQAEEISGGRRIVHTACSPLNWDFKSNP